MELVLDHIGVVVKNISDAKDYYIRTYGCKVLTDIINEPAHNVDIMFLSMGHGSMPMFELIQPVNDKSKVSGFLKKTGGGIHHLAYEVANIDIAIEHFKSLKSMILGDIVPGAGHNNTRTVWLYTHERNLVELIEEQHQSSAEDRIGKLST